jgi:membrane-bound lytic murein transglycosylase A
MVYRFRLCFFVLFWPLVTSCCLPVCFHSDTENYKTLYRLRQHEFPEFIDDMDRASLIECAGHHLSYLTGRDPSEINTVGRDQYSNGWLRYSIASFLEKLATNPSPADLRLFLSDNYLIYQAGGREDQNDRRMLVTGYYEPLFEGNLIRQAPFLWAIYAPPPSLVTSLGSKGEVSTGRIDQDRQVISYWSRKEIETTPELLRGNELVFLKDPFDAFVLHVQGSGKIQFPDKSVRPIHFAGSNGHPYKSIGKLLVDEQALTLEEVTVPAIRKYLELHPDQQQRILNHNPRFIFFQWGDDMGPKGSYNEVLTPGRSIAIDNQVLPGGALGYLISRAPQIGESGQIGGWKQITRFVCPQDSGEAIKGGGRVDIFWGGGQDAEFTAGHMKETGKLFFLVKKPPDALQ